MTTYIRVTQADSEIRVPVISPALYDELIQVEPSLDRYFEYRPCQVQMGDGRIIDKVYLAEAVTFMLSWGYDPKRATISILDVAHMGESPSRLPIGLANILYEKGETSMGGTTFTIVLRDGKKAHGTTGNAVDFLNYPPGVQPSDVVDVLHGRSEGDDTFTLADYIWCPYSLPPSVAAHRLRNIETFLKNSRMKWSFEPDT